MKLGFTSPKKSHVLSCQERGWTWRDEAYNFKCGHCFEQELLFFNSHRVRAAASLPVRGSDVLLVDSFSTEENISVLPEHEDEFLTSPSFPPFYFIDPEGKVNQPISEECEDHADYSHRSLLLSGIFRNPTEMATWSKVQGLAAAEGTPFNCIVCALIFQFPHHSLLLLNCHVSPITIRVWDP